MITAWGVVPSGCVLPSEWAWILENAAHIDKAAWFGVRGTPLPIDDFRSALITDLATNFSKFDPTRGSPKNFINMRVTATRRTLVRRGLRNTFAELIPDIDPSPPGSLGSTEKTEARAELALLFERANRRERVALLSIAKSPSSR